jgi:hypothetical protein
MVLPFKDSEGGTCSYSILIEVTSAGTRQRKSKRSMLTFECGKVAVRKHSSPGLRIRIRFW